MYNYLKTKIMIQNFHSISDFTKNVSRGTFGISLITLTEPKMRKTNNPYFGRIHKATYMTNVALGYDYENSVNNRLDKKGIESNFQAEKPKGKSWDEYPYILQADKDTSIKYLRCTMRQNTKAKSVFILDGKIVTDASVEAEIKTFIQTSSTSKKQAEIGLYDTEQVIVRDYKLDGVIYLGQGEKSFNRVLGFADIAKLRDFFK